MKKQLIIDKSVYGGMLVEKYFLKLEDGADIQLPYNEWTLHQIGSMYPETLLKPPDNTPLESYVDWKEMHDIQQKLAIGYALENEDLKRKIKTLELNLRVEELTNHLLSKSYLKRSCRGKILGTS